MKKAIAQNLKREREANKSKLTYEVSKLDPSKDEDTINKLLEIINNLC